MKPAIPLLTLALAGGAATMVILSRPGDGDSRSAPSNNNATVRTPQGSELFFYPPVKDATLTFMHSDGTEESVWISHVERGANGQVTVEAVVSVGGEEALPVTVVTEPDGGFRTDVRKFFMVDMMSHLDLPPGVDVRFYGDHDYWLPSIQRMREGAVSQGSYSLVGSGEMDGHAGTIEINMEVWWSSSGSPYLDEIPFIRDADDPNGFEADAHDDVKTARVSSSFESTISMGVNGVSMPEQTTENTLVAWFVPGFGRIYQKTIDEEGNIIDTMWLTESSVLP